MYMIFEGLQTPFMSKTACQNMSKYIKTCQLQFWLITLCFLTMWSFGPKGGPPCQPRHPAFYATNPAIDNYCGNDAWDQTCNSQTWSTSQTCQLAGISDVPPQNGQLSDALQQRLAEEDISDVEVLLRYRGIRTLRAVESLETTERVVLLCKARELYELLGIFPSHIKNALNKLFGDVAQQGMCQGYPWAGQADRMSYMHQQRAGHHGRSQQQAAPSQRPGGPEPFIDPLDDDSFLKRTFGAALLGAKEIVGWERYTECLRRLKRSQELVVASCSEAAEALAALGIRKEDLRDRERKEALKLAKKVVRDILLWRCASYALGLDSREALVRAFEESCRHTHCDENTVSQLTNAYRRVREELAGGPAPKNRVADRTQEGGSTSGAAGSTRGAAGSQGGQQQPRQQATGIAVSEGCGANGNGSQMAAEDPNMVLASLDPLAPSPSDAVLPHPADAGLHDIPRQGRSLPPTRRSPDPRSRDAGHSLQIAQLLEMMKAMAHQIQDVKAQVGKFQQDRDPFPFRPFLPYDTDEEDDQVQ